MSYREQNPEAWNEGLTYKQIMMVHGVGSNTITKIKKGLLG